MNRAHLPALILAAFALLVTATSAFAAADFMVLRVGTGTSVLNSAATAVFVEQHSSNGTIMRTISLPTTASLSQEPLTLSGTATSDGRLSRSADKRFLLLAGYAAVPGVASVVTSASSAIPRVAARIDVDGHIDSSTQFTGAFNGGNVRACASVDGTRVWLAGTSSGSTGGLYTAAFGANGPGTQVMAVPGNCRNVAIANGQLYGSSGSAGFTNVFTIGAGVPETAGQSATSLTGFPVTGASPYEFVFDPSGTVCYVADDRSLASGGGLQVWYFNGTQWSLATTFTLGLTTGVRGLTGDFTGPFPRLYVTTTESSSNAVYAFTDDGTPNPSATFICAAPTNTVYRGLVRVPVTTLGVPQDTGQGVRLSSAPNPCRIAATLSYTLAQAGEVSLRLFDAQGRQAAVVTDEWQPAGAHAARVDTRLLPRGLYFARLLAGGRTSVTKLLLTD